MQEVLTAKMRRAARIRERGGASGPVMISMSAFSLGRNWVKRCLPSSVPCSGRLVPLEEPEDLAALHHDGDVAVEQLLAVCGAGRLLRPHAMSASSLAK